MLYYDDSRAERRSRIAGGVAAAAYMVVVVALLLLLRLSPAEPATGEEGIMIALGDSFEAGADMVPEPETASEGELFTQDHEEAPEISAPPVVEPESKPEPQPEPERRPDPAALFPGRGASQGNEQGDGRQGAPTGAADGNPTGTGQGSAGNGFDLSGRHLRGALPSPDYPSNRSGRVVVDIAVDENGVVTRAAVRIQGTTTNDAALVSAALDAARRARFNEVDANAGEQRGTITYNFILK